MNTCLTIPSYLKVLYQYIKYKSWFKYFLSDKITHSKINYDYVNFLNKINDQICDKSLTVLSIKKNEVVDFCIVGGLFCFFFLVVLVFWGIWVGMDGYIDVAVMPSILS